MSVLPTDVCALGAHSVYNTKGINWQKRFMKLTPVTNFIKLFWHNLGCYWCATSSFDSGYALGVWGFKLCQKSFMKLTPALSFLWRGFVQV
jgi:hypothetical protein